MKSNCDTQVPPSDERMNYSITLAFRLVKYCCTHKEIDKTNKQTNKNMPFVTSPLS